MPTSITGTAGILTPVFKARVYVLGFASETVRLGPESKVTVGLGSESRVRLNSSHIPSPAGDEAFPLRRSDVASGFCSVLIMTMPLPVKVSPRVCTSERCPCGSKEESLSQSR
eukprot:2669468-Rhodomonas_salina.1